MSALPTGRRTWSRSYSKGRRCANGWPVAAVVVASRRLRAANRPRPRGDAREGDPPPGLKPENVFITKDERVKILDFGLAKLGASRAGGEDFTQAQTVPGATEPGLVLGTVGYMSPEQVRGLTTDARSDIFSFGAIVYEMIAGRRAFSRESSVETMNAILAAEPPELSSAGGGVSPGIERIVRHCLEKSPEARFQSARDLAFARGGGIWRRSSGAIG